jgi:hypothetical protein
MKVMRLTASVVTTLIVLAAIPADAAEDPVVDPAADMLLQRMGAVLAAANEFTVTNVFTSDEVVTTGEIVQLEGTVEIARRQRDGLRAAISGDFGSKNYFFDGKKMTFADGENRTYASVAITGTIDEVTDAMWQNFGIKIPLVDFLVSDPYADLMENVQTGFYAGLHMVDGVRHHHLVFIEEEIDWQIWIADGVLPLPSKMVITYKLEDGYPQYTATLTDWNLSPGLNDAVFNFVPPTGTIEIEFATVDDSRAGE